VIAQLVKNRKESFKINLLKFLGGMPILSDPGEIVKSLGTGVKQIFYHPNEGFIKGSIKGSYGLVKGAGHLGINTVGGLMGNVS